ncbi:U3 small nucleolar RNA-associated protein 25 homolog [Apostichopus japonicus]|uniref:U3 small nucleolar RNA-associated protein 25 homolog n=1 Tax=Stichopus japonicus TaxID=307972 RepID=UPI003AB860A5
MGRKRHFNRGGPGQKKKKRRNLVEVNEKAQKRIQREKDRKKFLALRAEGLVQTQRPTNSQEEFGSSSESEAETTVYDELLSSLKEAGGQTSSGDSDIDDESDGEEEEEIEDQRVEGEVEGRGDYAERDAGEEMVDLEQSDEEDDDDEIGDEDGESDEDGREEQKSLEGGEDEDGDSDSDDDGSVKADDGGRDWEVEQEESDEDEVDEDEIADELEEKQNKKDPFFIRVHTDLDEKEVEEMKSRKLEKLSEFKWPVLGQLTLSSNCKTHVVHPYTSKETEYQKLHIKKKLLDHWPSINKEHQKDGSADVFSPLQRELFSSMNSYVDLLYPEVTHETTDKVRNIYCLHVVNHILKNRTAVHKHNNFLASNPGSDSDDFRDQGLTRPKVLIVVPFRHTLMQVVNIIIDLLLPKDGQHVSHRKRFNQEFGDKYSGKIHPKKPEDWQKTFAGNIDDHFKIGLAFSKKSLRLYTPFYQSDIIIASPLGLRTIIGSKGDKHQEFDFLSSIEILVMEQMDVFLMQNWEHVLHLLDYMHLQPKDSHGVDFSRVKMWALNGWTKFYRQSLLFSQLSCPEIKAVMNKYCRNFSGQLSVSNPTVDGSICQVATELQQVFQRIKVDSFINDPDERFKHFTTKILPPYKDSLLKGTMIFIPSYFDYVRVRNYFRKEGLNFCQICEYSNPSEISRVKQYLIKGSRHFLLYTERYHFFQRIMLRGIHHVIFYQPPIYSHFYSELCNMIQSTDAASDATCRVLYSKYDSQRIAGIVGSKRGAQMISSVKDLHMLESGEET